MEDGMLMGVKTKVRRHLVISQVSRECNKAVFRVNIAIHCNHIHSEDVDGGWKVLEEAPASDKVSRVMNVQDWKWHASGWSYTSSH
jgi:hypothetical protein